MTERRTRRIEPPWGFLSPSPVHSATKVAREDFCRTAQMSGFVRRRTSYFFASPELDLASPRGCSLAGPTGGHSGQYTKGLPKLSQQLLRRARPNEAFHGRPIRSSGPVYRKPYDRSPHHLQLPLAPIVVAVPSDERAQASAELESLPQPATHCAAPRRARHRPCLRRL